MWLIDSFMNFVRENQTPNLPEAAREKETLPFIGSLVKHMNVVDSILRIITDKDYNRGLPASKELLKKCQAKFLDFNEIIAASNGNSSKFNSNN